MSEADMQAADAPESGEAKPLTSYDLIGGAEAVRRLADRFYDIMDEEHAAAGIRHMHAQDLGQIKERLFEFMSGWLGGPQDYFQRADRPCIRSAHRPYAIGEGERDQWLMCMRRAMVETEVPEAVHKLLDQAFFRMADMLRSR